MYERMQNLGFQLSFDVLTKPATLYIATVEPLTGDFMAVYQSPSTLTTNLYGRFTDQGDGVFHDMTFAGSITPRPTRPNSAVAATRTQFAGTLWMPSGDEFGRGSVAFLAGWYSYLMRFVMPKGIPEIVQRRPFYGTGFPVIG